VSADRETLVFGHFEGVINAMASKRALCEKGQGLDGLLYQAG
jgi:hypothetical protein